ncbi:MAG: DUF3298 domain-containing protein [Acidaminobacteraceae bacterium]
MNSLDDFKKEYDNIDIPKELDEMINKTIKNDTKYRNKRRLNAIVSSAAAIALLVLPLNLIPSFADSISEIPVIGSIAKVLTLKNYTTKSENIEQIVNMPAVSEMSDSEYQETINSIIEEKISNSLKEAKLGADEYKEAYIETGGSEEGFKEKNMQVKVDYKIYSSNNNSLSFLVFSHESLAAAYAEYSYFNIDVENNKDLTLEDLLGVNYQVLITNSVLKDIQIQKNSGEISFFEDVDSSNFLVRTDVDFYINSDNCVVIVFDKYEIAPGVFGRLEYTIKN